MEYTKNMQINKGGLNSIHIGKERGSMRLISKSDIEAIQISNLLSKTNSRKTAYNRVLETWENDNTNMDTAFLFSTFALASVYEETIAPERHRYLSQAIDALSICIKQQDDWWMARFLRSVALQSILVSADGMSLQNENDEDDCDILIKQQKESTEKAPYFLCPYLMKAKSYIFQGYVDQGIALINKGLENVELSAVKYPLNILLQPFGDNITILRSIGRDDLAEPIKNVGCILFPSSSSLAAI